MQENQIDITVEQWRILFYLWNQDGLNQRELATIANKEKSTITRQVDVLEKKKLIERRNAPTDKRNKLIFLTQKGKEIEEVALNAARNITQKAEENISKDELKIFKKVITQIIDNIK